MGPVLRGNVGQFIAVTFLNRCSRPLSIHPHGLKYDKDGEGSFYQPKPGLGAAVGSGATFTYVWQADAESGPAPGEPSSKGWLYHSHVQGDEESDLGLVGFIVVTDPKRARPNGTPEDVDRELAALLMIHDESGMGAAIKEAAEYGGTVAGMPALSWAQVQETMEQGARHAINGYIFGNTPGLEMNEGNACAGICSGSVRKRISTGNWLFHCHVAEHMMEGMFARVVVHAKGAAGVDRAPERAFFGLPQARESLRVTRARAMISGGRGEIQIEGVVTVHQAFSAFVPVFELQVGDATAQFQLTRQGSARNTNGTFRAKNANPYGVVYGGALEFEAALSGPQWAEQLVRRGAGPGGGDLQVPVSLQVGKAKHSASALIEVKPAVR